MLNNIAILVTCETDSFEGKCFSSILTESNIIKKIIIFSNDFLSIKIIRKILGNFLKF